MCQSNCTPTLCASIILAIIGVTYIYDLIIDDDYGGYYYEDNEAYTSCTRNTKNAKTSCDTDPQSRASCCYVNPVIKSQMQTMWGSGCGNSGECFLCLPNVGSKYLGATVVSTRDTKPYRHPLGTEASAKTNKPELTIKPKTISVGENWHFEGVGTLVVRLFYPAHISGFSILHPPRCEIPQGYESSTPKDFHVMGLTDINDDEPFLFGNYTYNIDGPVMQVFPVQSCSKTKFQLIEFQFTANHGNPDYTALYKVRIYGDMGPPPNTTSSKNGPKSGKK